MAGNLTIVAVSYMHGRKLPIFVNSVIEQTSRDWELILIHDGLEVDEQWLRNIQDMKTIGNGPEYSGPRIRSLRSKERYNDFGHSLRAIGLEMADGDYVNFTNADNYMCPRFVELMLESARAHEADFVHCDILHNYACTIFPGGGPYQVLKSAPVMNHIDMSNFIVKTDLAQDVGFNHRVMAADGLFVQDIFNYKPDLKSAKVDAVLCVHN